MTCIAAVTANGYLTIAGDSQGSVPGTWQMYDRRDEKVFALTDWMGVGFTTSYRLGQIVRYHLPPLDEPTTLDRHAWMVSRFVPELRGALRQHGWVKAENGRDEGGTMIVSIRSDIFVIYDDFQVAQPALPFCAIGAGGDVATGYLQAAMETPLADRSRRAARAALPQRATPPSAPAKVVTVTAGDARLLIVLPSKNAVALLVGLTDHLRPPGARRSVPPVQPAPTLAEAVASRTRRAVARLRRDASPSSSGSRVLVRPTSTRRRRDRAAALQVASRWSIASVVEYGEQARPADAHARTGSGASRSASRPAARPGSAPDPLLHLGPEPVRG